MHVNIIVIIGTCHLSPVTAHLRHDKIRHTQVASVYSSSIVGAVRQLNEGQR